VQIAVVYVAGCHAIRRIAPAERSRSKLQLPAGGRRMPRILAAMSVIVALVAPADATAGERMIDLFRRGYQLVATEPYLSFEGCEFGFRSAGTFSSAKPMNTSTTTARRRYWAAHSL
jgi:hypothetical protein